MARYIDIEPIERAAKIGGYCTVSLSLINEQPTADVVDKERYDRLLKNAIIISEELNRYQTADVVEVVRCKDCKFYETNQDECVFYNAQWVKHEDDFCPYGERRDDAT